MKYRRVITFILIVSSLIGCTSVPGGSVPTPIPTNELSKLDLPTISPTPNATVAPSAFVSESTSNEFPGSIDPTKQYLFYLHGKIIEDQGIPAISPDFGEYEYEVILEKLRGYGFVVISEQRPKNTNGVEYARKIRDQVMTLLDADVPATNITVVGASKGAGIVIYVSHFLENDEVNYVIMSICHPDYIEDLKQNQIILKGNVLSIYDSTDEFAGSCQELFSFSEGKGMFSYDEIVLNVGTGHGILYKPLDEWILPTMQWANNNFQ
jgi:hypothetical protein